MRSMFLKIFAMFWLAQSLIFVISTAFILRQHFPNPGILSDFLFNSLRNEARESAAAYESGGCSALAAYAQNNGYTLSLEEEDGKSLCSQPQDPAAQLEGETTFPERIVGKQIGDRYIWNVPVTSASGKRYMFLRSRPHQVEHEHFGFHSRLFHFAFPQAPVAIAVGGVTTLILAMLFTRPIVRLRTAAGELARGNLSTRVSEASRSRLFKGDEFDALARDFNFMAERLESLVAAQQLLLRDVSHELRSPLARLNVALELVREDGTPEVEPYLDRIERETHKLNQLIGQLLELSSMEAVEKIDDFAPVSLNQILEEIIPDAKYEASQRQCTVQFTSTGEYSIRGNRLVLYRAIENVVRNAIRYTAQGSAVEIRLFSEPGPKERLAVLDVLDHGPGIPESEIENIFRPFYRVDRARSPETGGFGVGLAITDRAVKLHGGKLQVFNRPEGGACIRMSFSVDTASTLKDRVA